MVERDDVVEETPARTTRRVIVTTGAKLGYAAPLIAASFKLQGMNAALAASPNPCVGGGVCLSDADCCGDETCVGGICSVAACEGKVCGTFTQCHPTADCQCYSTPEGAGVCGCNTLCSAAPPCTTSAECGAGHFCAVNSCCGAAGVCIPICTSESTCQLGGGAEAIGAGTTTSGH